MSIAPRQCAIASTAGDTMAPALAVNTLLGSALYAGVILTSATETVSTITDTQGNTWTLVAAAHVGAVARFELWKTIAGSAAANTATIALSAAAASRSWLIEISGMGATLTDGPSNTLDVNVAVDPLTGATLAVDAVGVAFFLIRFDTTAGVSAGMAALLDGQVGDAPGAWLDLGADGSSSSRAGLRILDGSSITLEPKFDATNVETGQSLTVAVYGEAVTGGFVPIEVTVPVPIRMGVVGY